ncbi:hypothetical protein ACFC3F_04860 [Microbacterium sp. NPDC055910]|uniref:hypothetical protein n=1 Tax=Microbacterium sp. NPDC055910 TaxID=3345659 RepID=UPI0035DE48DD
MTSTPENPHTDGEDLVELREEIDQLKAIPEEELVSPTPTIAEEIEPVPHPTNAIGSEQWDKPVEDESLEQE